MAKDGLPAAEYSEWIDEDISVDNKIKEIIEEFVVGTPAQGLSRKGRNLHDYYHIESEMEYKLLYDEMIAGVNDVFCAETYATLAKELKNHSWLGFSSFPQEVEEAIYIYVGNYKNDELYKAHFSHLTPITSKNSTNDERHAQAEPREIIARVNKIFYHLRNSIAHGSYGIFEGEETFLIFQDESKEHFVSARMILKEERLFQWIKLLETKHAEYDENNHAVNEEALQCPA